MTPQQTPDVAALRAQIEDWLTTKPRELIVEPLLRECLAALKGQTETTQAKMPVGKEWIPTKSPIDEARAFIAGCKNRSGVIHKPSLLSAVTDLVLERNRYMERLGLIQMIRFKDIAPPASTPEGAE